MNNIIQRESIEEILMKQGKIKKEQLDRIISKGLTEDKPLTKSLVAFGLISEEDMLTTLSNIFGYPFVHLTNILKEQPPVKIETISVNFLKEYKLFPLSQDNGVLRIAISDPSNESLLDELVLITGKKLSVQLSTESEIMDAIEKYYGAGTSAMERIIGDMNEEELDIMTEDNEEDIEHLKDIASEAPVIKLVNLIISKAVEIGASDIHIEPFEDTLRIRYRIDGVLHNVESPPKKFKSALISRIKIMAKLNIAEHRLPQDGRIKLRVIGKEIDMRISTLPTLYGESVVMRILDQDSTILKLTELGFPEDSLKHFNELIYKPYGMILVTGPTGSGKTTTLYAALNIINSTEKKIITIEDPVEYQIQGINQIHVKPQIGLNFANGLRSIVRQDPDIIMVGEIRDPETADIAIQASLTGHLVFSTVHTNDAAGAITRLLDMGIENYLISSAILATLAQRLVRVICSKCKVPVDINSYTNNPDLSLSHDDILYQGSGCPDCNFTGFKGRIGIYELLLINDDIRKLILEKASANQIKDKAREQGMITLREDGWRKVKAGLTTISEVLRVTLDEEL